MGTRPEKEKTDAEMKPKRSKKLIAGICILTVLLIGEIGFFAYLLVDRRDELLSLVTEAILQKSDEEIMSEVAKKSDEINSVAYADLYIGENEDDGSSAEDDTDDADDTEETGITKARAQYAEAIKNAKNNPERSAYWLQYANMLYTYQSSTGLKMFDSEILDAAYKAESLNPNYSTATMIAFYEGKLGNTEKSKEYSQLAEKRKAENGITTNGGKG